jgi:periplasmic divalent cation tolerance protein
MTTLLMTYCPCPNNQEAQRLAELLLHKKLAACVQIIPGIQSLYWWQGTIQQDQEFSLVIKSPSTLAAEVMTLLDQEHPYDCPCIIQHHADHVNGTYLSWLQQACQA